MVSGRGGSSGTNIGCSWICFGPLGVGIGESGRCVVGGVIGAVWGVVADEKSTWRSWRTNERYELCLYKRIRLCQRKRENDTQ